MKNYLKTLLVALVATVGFGLVAGPAGATGDPLKQSAEVTADCGEATLKFVNNHDHATKDFTYVWNVQTSDGQNFNVSVPNSESPVTKVVTLEPGEDDGWVSYGVVAGPESDYYLANETLVVPLCEPEPEPDPDPTTTTTESTTTTTAGDTTTTTEGPATTTTVEIETPTTVLGEDGPDHPGSEPATTDVVCDDFTSVADANAHFAQYPADFDRLDGDNDGIACEEQFGDGTQPVASAGELPRTGVDSTTGLLAAAGAFITAGTVLGMMARRREYLARQ